MESARLGNLLEKKRFSLERIKQIFIEQAICLDNSQIQLFLAKSQIVDRLLFAIQGIDSELAQLGARPHENGTGGEFIALEKAILELTKESCLALKESDSRLKKMKDDIRNELNSVVSYGQIKAYKPLSVGRAIYFDRRN